MFRVSVVNVVLLLVALHGTSSADVYYKDKYLYASDKSYTTEKEAKEHGVTHLKHAYGRYYDADKYNIQIIII